MDLTLPPAHPRAAAESQTHTIPWVIGQKVCLESRLRPCGVWRFMGSKVGDMTFAPGRNVCLESLSALTAAWVDSRSKVPVPWCHGTAIVPAVRREDEKERHDQRGQDPLAVQGPGMRVEQDARLWHGRAPRARVHRLAPVGGHPRATACVFVFNWGLRF